MKFLTVAGGYTYVSEVPVKVGDIVVASFGYGLDYLEVKRVGTTRKAVGCTYTGPLKVIERVVTPQEAKLVARADRLTEQLERTYKQLRKAANGNHVPGDPYSEPGSGMIRR